MRISDWSSDVCSSDLPLSFAELGLAAGWSGYREDTDILVYAGDNENDLTDLELDDEDSLRIRDDEYTGTVSLTLGKDTPFQIKPGIDLRSEEHTSELQSLMRISYAVFCLKKKNIN